METKLERIDPCPFCKSDFYRLSESDRENILVVKDLNPVTPGHRLVVPRVHYESLLELTPTLVGELFQVAAKVAREAVSSGADGFNLGINDGAVAGQSVPHVHIHVIPRYLGDVENPFGGVRGVIAARQRYSKQKFSFDN